MLLFKIRMDSNFSFLGIRRKPNLSRLNDKLPCDTWIDWDTERHRFTCDETGLYGVHTCNPEEVDRTKIQRLIESRGFTVVSSH